VGRLDVADEVQIQTLRGLGLTTLQARALLAYATPTTPPPMAALRLTLGVRSVGVVQAILRQAALRLSAAVVELRPAYRRRELQELLVCYRNRTLSEQRPAGMRGVTPAIDHSWPRVNLVTVDDLQLSPLAAARRWVRRELGAL
jgi:hypothetical protein